MRTLIIGSGNMGRGIAMRLVSGRNDVTVYDIDHKVSQTLAKDLGRSTRNGGSISATTSIIDAIAANEIIILASWYHSNLSVAKEYGDALRGKIVVDISNPLNTTYDGLVTSPDQSAAEVIRSLLPAEARVVKAFNTTFAPTLQEGHVAGHPLDVFVASDDEAAKEILVTMIRGSGMNPIDAGRLERARQLEALGLLGITLQGPLGTAFRSGWRLVLPQAA